MAIKKIQEKIEHIEERIEKLFGYGIHNKDNADQLLVLLQVHEHLTVLSKKIVNVSGGSLTEKVKHDFDEHFTNS